MSALPSSAVPTLPIAVAAAARTLGLGVLECRHEVRDRAAPAEDADRVGRLGPDALLLVPQGAGQAAEDARVHRGVGRHRRAVVLVGEGLQEAVDRAAAVALGVDLDDRPDGLLADAGVAVLQRGHEGGDGREVAQRAQGLHHLEAHLDLGVAHEGRERGHRLAAPALAELRRRRLAGPRGRALQVRDEVLERLLGPRAGGQPPREARARGPRAPGRRRRTTGCTEKRCIAMIRDDSRRTAGPRASRPLRRWRPRPGPAPAGGTARCAPCRGRRGPPACPGRGPRPPPPRPRARGRSPSRPA